MGLFPYFFGEASKQLEEEKICDHVTEIHLMFAIREVESFILSVQLCYKQADAFSFLYGAYVI